MTTDALVVIVELERQRQALLREAVAAGERFWDPILGRLVERTEGTPCN